MALEASLRQYNAAESNVPSLVLTQRFIYVRAGSVVDPQHFGNNFKKRNAANNSPQFAYSSGHCLFILLYWAETEIHKIKDDSKIDREKNIDRLGPSRIRTV